MPTLLGMSDDLEGPIPPPDPRSGWGLPPPGGMPTVSRLDELVVRVLAPNPSPMTLDGTNTYVVAVPGTGEALIVDPGPSDADHLVRVRDVLRRAEAVPRWIAVTHHHVDHTEAAARWAASLGAVVVAPARQTAGPDGHVVGDGATLPLAGCPVEVFATPGHTRDHVTFRLASGALLTGDHVLGRGTSVVAYPDGDLAAYLRSLRRVLDLGPDVLYPGHGPELTVDPNAVIRYYLDHRRFREQQILFALGAGPSTPPALVAAIYHEVDRRLWPAAEASLRAALAVLADAGQVALGPNEQVRLLDVDHSS
jgi:glyoxylase-like metal-dependent hydrolase (beta-lactamase superfamily II)